MKVSICKKCLHYHRRTWTHRHSSANYHDIGMTHAYGYCDIWGKRCSEVSAADCQAGKMDNKEPLVCPSCGAEISWYSPASLPSAPYICSSDFMDFGKPCRVCHEARALKGGDHE